MYNVLVVDDYPDLVKSVSKMIRDSQLPQIGQVFEAHSAYEGLQYLRDNRIALVITDIKMPEMDGLAFIEEIRIRHPETMYLLLSGYSDFKYAQQAIEKKALKYLLKPVDEDELIGTVRESVNQMEKSRIERQARQKLHYTFFENLQGLRADLLNQLLQGKELSPALLAHKLSSYDIGIRCGDRAKLLIVNTLGLTTDTDNSDRSLMDYAILNIAGEVIGQRYPIWCCTDPYDYLVILIGYGAGEEEQSIEQLARQFHAIVRSLLKLETTMALIDPPVRFPEGCAESYKAGLLTIRRYADSAFVVASEGNYQEAAVDKISAMYETPSLILLLETGQWEAAMNKLQSIIGNSRESALLSNEHIKEIFFYCANAFTYIAHQNKHTITELLGDKLAQWMEGKPFRDAAQLAEWSAACVLMIKSRLAPAGNSSKSRLIDAIHTFIELQLCNDASLQAIGDHVKLHPIYLSKVYKAETGKNLLEYITELRMEKAINLLKDTDMKIYEISAAMGYQTPHYFTKLFRQYYGVTPQTYRDRHAGQDL